MRLSAMQALLLRSDYGALYAFGILSTPEPLQPKSLASRRLTPKTDGRTCEPWAQIDFSRTSLVSCEPSFSAPAGGSVKEKEEG